MDSLLSQDLQPSQVGRKILDRWPLIFTIAVLGGLVGLGANWISPPRYQATARLSIGPDPNLVAPLSDNVQYEADLRTQDLFLSDATLEEARQALPADQRGPTVGSFRARLRLDHVGSSWYLRATAGSPTVSAATANAWASAAAAQFEAAQAHAINAGEFQALLFSVACKPQVVVDQSKPSLWACDEMSLDVKPEAVSPKLLAEARLSHGILPGLVIGDTQQAEPPNSPTDQARALFILGGTMVGLVLGSLAAWSGLILAFDRRRGPRPG